MESSRNPSAAALWGRGGGRLQPGFVMGLSILLPCSPALTWCAGSRTQCELAIRPKEADIHQIIGRMEFRL